MIHPDQHVLDYSDAGTPEGHVRRFFRRDLPLAIIIILMLLVTVFIVWATMLAGADGH